MLTDMDRWQWENLALPAGVRLAPFRHTLPTPEPITAVARFGPGGVEGKLTAAPFTSLADALLATPSGRHLAVRLHEDGAFTAGTRDILPAGQFLDSPVLSDRQQRRQDLYREFLNRKGPDPGDRSLLLAWADPVDTQFRLVPGGRTVGSALLVVPLRLERPAPGARVTIPGPLVRCQRVVLTGTRSSESPLIRESRADTDMHLRFQLPATVLPFTVERARLTARIDAPSRKVSIAVRTGQEFVEVHRVDSPLDPIRVDVREERQLRLDEEGGLHLRLSIGDPSGGAGGGRRTSREQEKWTIEYVELEVSGQRH
jgi:hypothetical protein